MTIFKKVGGRKPPLATHKQLREFGAKTLKSFSVFASALAIFTASTGSQASNIANTWAADAFNPEMELITDITTLSGSHRNINFNQNGYPLDTHTCAEFPLEHLQAVIRLPDANGKQYYMGTFSQDTSDTEGGMVFVGEVGDIDSGNIGNVIWMDELNDLHRAGGYNHPGDLHRIGDTVVIAGQNWGGRSFPCNIVRGQGNLQHVLFYDVTNPAKPEYTGKLNSCWNGNQEVTVSGEIDTIEVTKSGEFYYLAFNGLKCRSTAFHPNARWELINGNSGNAGFSPAYFTHNGTNYIGAADVEAIVSNAPYFTNYTDVHFKKFEFLPSYSNVLSESTTNTQLADVSTVNCEAPSCSHYEGNVPPLKGNIGNKMTLSSLPDGSFCTISSYGLSGNPVEIREICGGGSYGPLGGNGGSDFQDNVPSTFDRVKSVTLCGGNRIDSVKASILTKTGATLNFARHGGGGGSCTTLNLSAGEFISSVTGKHGSTVDSLTITTNFGQSVSKGGGGGHTNFSYTGTAVKPIAGFKGRSGNMVDAIGVVIPPKR